MLVGYFCTIIRSDLAHGLRTLKQTKIPVTSLVFGNFYFDYYNYRFGLGLTLGLMLVFLGFIVKCLRTQNVCQAFSIIVTKRLVSDTVLFNYIYSQWYIMV